MVSGARLADSENLGRADEKHGPRSAQTECSRHRLSWTSGSDDLYCIKRCAHFGNRFVVEIRSVMWPGGFVDYVEDLPDGGVNVEGHGIMRNVGGGMRQVNGKWMSDAIWKDIGDELWKALKDRMLADDPPDPERGS